MCKGNIKSFSVLFLCYFSQQIFVQTLQRWNRLLLWCSVDCLSGWAIALPFLLHWGSLWWRCVKDEVGGGQLVSQWAATVEWVSFWARSPSPVLSCCHMRRCRRLWLIVWWRLFVTCHHQMWHSAVWFWCCWMMEIGELSVACRAGTIFIHWRTLKGAPFFSPYLLWRCNRVCLG